MPQRQPSQGGARLPDGAVAGRLFSACLHSCAIQCLAVFGDSDFRGASPRLLRSTLLTSTWMLGLQARVHTIARVTRCVAVFAPQAGFRGAGTGPLAH